jgi:hypothetical protein
MITKKISVLAFLYEQVFYDLVGSPRDAGGYRLNCHAHVHAFEKTKKTFLTSDFQGCVPNVPIFDGFLVRCTHFFSILHP